MSYKVEKRTLYEVYYYDEHGSNPQGPFYTKNMKELREMNIERGISISHNWLRANIIDKVPDVGGQALLLRVYRVSFGDLLGKINQCTSEGVPFEGIKKPPQDTVREVCEAHDRAPVYGTSKNNGLPALWRVNNLPCLFGAD